MRVTMINCKLDNEEKTTKNWARTHQAHLLANKKMLSKWITRFLPDFENSARSLQWDCLYCHQSYGLTKDGDEQEMNRMERDTVIVMTEQLIVHQMNYVQGDKVL